MNISLKNKNALICGSSEGIGKAIAVYFSELGANVTLVARSEDRLKSALNELDFEDNQTHNFIVADFSDPYKAVEKIKDQNSSYDILVNNSGGPAHKLIQTAKESEFLDAFNQHVILSQKLVQMLLPQMKENNFGRIINIISIGLKQPIDGLGVSNTIRAAMAGWAKTMSREIAKYGITVNNILPGFTKTGRLNSLMETRAQNAGVSVKEITNRIYADIPAGRFADPSEVAYLAGFLASGFADYISGTSIPVDGGYLRTI